MNNNEAQYVLEEILAQAEAGQSTEFRFIISLADFKSCFMMYKANKLIIKMLKQASKRLFKTYCKDVTSGISDVTKLLAYSQLDDVIDYYKKEVKTIEDMIYEYEDYLAHGNLFYALLGGERWL
jgi:succinylglutamate desuccinylase